MAEKCIYTDTRGFQCTEDRIPGSAYCAKHTKRKRKTKLDLLSWRERVDTIASGKVKDLSEEVAILRLVLENTIKMCTDGPTLVAHNATIALTVDKIDKLIQSTLKIEKHEGDNFSSAQLLEFTEDIIAIIAEHVDNDAMYKISNAIMELELINETLESDF